MLLEGTKRVLVAASAAAMLVFAVRAAIGEAGLYSDHYKACQPTQAILDRLCYGPSPAQSSNQCRKATTAASADVGMKYAARQLLPAWSAACMGGEQACVQGAARSRPRPTVTSIALVLRGVL